MSREGEKPSMGEAIIKEFFGGPPPSVVLTRGEQSLVALNRGNELASDQSQSLTRIASLQQDSGRAITENLILQRREDQEAVARNREQLGDIAWNQTEQIRASEEMTSKIGDLGDIYINENQALRGTPRDLPDFSDFIRSGPIDIGTLVYLSDNNYLSRKIDSRYLSALDLPDAQKIVLCNYLKDGKGLFRMLREYFGNPRMSVYEATEYYFNYIQGSDDEKAISGQIPNSLPPQVLEKYLRTLARYSFLNKDLHYRLAESRGGRAFRSGTEGTNLGVREINAQLDEQLQQKEESLLMQRAGLHQGEIKILRDRVAAVRRDQMLEVQQGIGQDMSHLVSKANTAEIDRRGNRVANELSALLAFRAEDKRLELLEKVGTLVDKTEIAETDRQAIRKADELVAILALRAEAKREDQLISTRKIEGNIGVLVNQGGIEINQREFAKYQRDLAINLLKSGVSRQDVEIALARSAEKYLERIAGSSSATADGVGVLVSLTEIANINRAALLSAVQTIGDNMGELVRKADISITNQEIANHHLEGILQADETTAIYAADISANTRGIDDKAGELVRQGKRIGDASEATAVYTEGTFLSVREIAERMVTLLQHGSDISGFTEATAIHTENIENAIMRYGEEHGVQLQEHTGLFRELVNLSASGNSSLQSIENTLGAMGQLLPEGLKNIHLSLVKIMETVEKSSQKQGNAVIEAINLIRIQQELVLQRQDQVIQQQEQAFQRQEQASQDQKFRETNRDRVSADESYRKGRAMLKMGNLDGAIKCFNEADDKWPFDHRVYYQRGLCFIGKGDEKAAEQDFVCALKLLPKKEIKRRAIILNNLGRLYYSASRIYLRNGDKETADKKLSDAIKAVGLALEGYPDYPDAKFAHANYLAASGAINESLKILLDVIPKDPKFILKIKTSEVFGPLRELLKTTLSASFIDTGMDPDDLISFTIMLDSIAAGDQEMAHKNLGSLIKERPQLLNQLRFWEMTELKPFLEQIKEMLLAEISQDETAHSSDDWYALASMAINMAEMSIFKAYRVFVKGTKTDPDFLERNIKGIGLKLESIFGDNASEIVGLINTIRPRDFPWLVTKL